MSAVLCSPGSTNWSYSGIGQAQERISELIEFTSQLQRAEVTLGAHTPDGACDDTCGCRSDPPRQKVAIGHHMITLDGVGADDLACSLDHELLGGRIDHWSVVLGSATSKDSIPTGIRVHFDDGVDIAALATLAAAEQSCCSFFRFAIGVGAEGITLEVTGPDEAQHVITAVFGIVADANASATGA